MLFAQSLRTAVICAATLMGITAHAEELRLTSPDLAPNGWLPDAQVFNGFGCQGQNISPALNWENLPAGTKSVALTVYDPDAPTGSGWWHWLVVNIPPTASGLVRDAGHMQNKQLPEGAIEVRSDYGSKGYGGACPPVGDKPHRYIFTVFALKTARIELPENATAALAGYMIRANALAQASFTVHYGRK